MFVYKFDWLVILASYLNSIFVIGMMSWWWLGHFGNHFYVSNVINEHLSAFDFLINN